MYVEEFGERRRMNDKEVEWCREGLGEEVMGLRGDRAGVWSYGGILDGLRERNGWDWNRQVWVVGRFHGTVGC